MFVVPPYSQLQMLATKTLAESGAEFGGKPQEQNALGQLRIFRPNFMPAK